MAATRASRLVSVDYEVFGTVQGVFFRKFTHKTAKELGLVGWVKNTRHSTVTGTVQGPEDKVNQMKHWLKNTGSPKSKITRCEFKNERSVDVLGFTDFDIIKESRKKKSSKS